MAARTRDAERSREAILAAAERLFAERGFDATSVGDIAAAAGLARGTPGYFFGSKLELYEHVLRRATAAREAAAHEAFAPVREWAAGDAGPDALRTALAAAVHRYFGFLAAHPAFARLIGWEAQAGAERLSSATARMGAVDAALAALHAVRRSRGLADFDPALVSVALVSMCFLPIAHETTFRATGGPDPADPAFRAAYETVVVDAVFRLLTG